MGELLLQAEPPDTHLLSRNGLVTLPGVVPSQNKAPRLTQLPSLQQTDFFLHSLHYRKNKNKK